MEDTLNRPEALNALTLDMVRAFEARLAAWQEDPEVQAVLVKGAGERAFCAGGDVRAIWNAAKEKDPLTAAFFYDEYRLNRRVFHFPKPYIALMDGVTMGGGVGISVHGSHRVATGTEGRRKHPGGHPVRSPGSPGDRHAEPP